MSKVMAIVLSVLATLVILVIIFYDANPSTKQGLKSNLSINKDDISAFEISHEGQLLTLSKFNEKWMLEDYPVDTSIINKMILSFSSIKIDRMVSTKKEKYKKFGVTDSSSTVKIINAKGETLLDLIIGVLGTTANETIVRERGNDEIVTVKDNLKQYLITKQPHFWEKLILDYNDNEIKSISFNGDAGNYELTHIDTGWIAENKAVTEAKSRPIVNVFNHLMATNFSDENEIADAYKVGETTVHLFNGEIFTMKFYTKPHRDTVVWIRLTGNSKILETSISRVNKLFVPSDSF